MTRHAHQYLTGFCLMACFGCHATAPVTRGPEVAEIDSRPSKEPEQEILDQQIAIGVSEPVAVRELLIQLCEVRFPNQCEIGPRIEGQFFGELPLQPLRGVLDALCRIGTCQWEMTTQPPGLVVVARTTNDL